MSILIDKSTRLLVQGITGRDGLFHAKKMAEYGTNVVGGTSPGKGGTMIDDTFPVFNTMHEGCSPNASQYICYFRTGTFAADAIMEAADAGIRLIICITEGIPTLDVIKGLPVCRTKGSNVGWPQLSGTDLSRRKSGRYSSGASVSGQCRSNQP